MRTTRPCDSTVLATCLLASSACVQQTSKSDIRESSSERTDSAETDSDSDTDSDSAKCVMNELSTKVVLGECSGVI